MPQSLPTPSAPPSDARLVALSCVAVASTVFLLGMIWFGARYSVTGKTSDELDMLASGALVASCYAMACAVRRWLK
jgi:hypothetical protein